MMLGQRDLRAKASMQCLFGLVNEPYFSLFSSIGFNFKVLTLGRLGLASHLHAMLPIRQRLVKGSRTVLHLELHAMRY